jgi:hypothetical protein
MKPINEKVIEQVFTKHMSLTPDKLFKVLEKDMTRQPDIFAFLDDVSEDLFPEEEEGFLAPLGALIIEVMSHGDRPLPDVKYDELVEAEEKNFEIISKLESSEEQGDISMIDGFVRYNQNILLNLIIDILLEPDEEDNLDEDLNETTGNGIIKNKEKTHKESNLRLIKTDEDDIENINSKASDFEEYNQPEDEDDDDDLDSKLNAIMSLKAIIDCLDK